MKLVLVDDEPVARRVLRELLDEIPGIEIAGEADNGTSALELIRQVSPDVVLLDWEMPGLDGFAVSRSIDRLPVVIFVTAYHQHALDAFEAGAVDYLLKPVRRERLEAALQKASAHLRGLDQQRPSETPPPARPEPRKIVGRIGQDLHLIDPEEIIAFLAEDDVVTIVTANGRYYASHSLRALEEKLPPGRFRRIHRAAIINTDQIRKISPLSSKRWLLRMSNGMELIVSKRLTGVIRDEMRW